MIDKEKFNALYDKYWEILKGFSTWKIVNKFIIITTFFIDRHNDHIQIYLSEDKYGNYIFSDNGDTINGFQEEGLFSDNEGCEKAINNIAKKYNINYSSKDNKLEIKSDLNNFVINQHFLLQAILALNEIFSIRYLSD